MKATFARAALSLGVLSVIFATPAFAIDKPAATWEPAARANFHRGRSEKISLVVIHTVEGSLKSCIATFQNPAEKVSAHYCVGKNGEIVQFVGDLDTAYHVRSANAHAIGIEHEGVETNPAMWTDAMYLASARLCRWLCDKYGLPIDRQHIMGHVEVPGNDHTDPGRFFDWPKYMALVRGVGGPDDATANIPAANGGGAATGSDSATGDSSGSNAGSGTDVGSGSSNGGNSSTANGGSTNKGIAKRLAGEDDDTPDRGPDPDDPRLSEGSKGEHVSRLQKILKADGHDISVDGKFGPETKKAVESFQRAHGLGVDGIVGPKTWEALEKVEKASATPALTTASATPARSRRAPPDGPLGAPPR